MSIGNFDQSPCFFPSILDTCLEEEDVVTPSPDRDSITLHYTYDQEDIPDSAPFHNCWHFQTEI
jgi:hypothetical protein